MTCEEFRERLSELVDGELSDEQESRMYAHAEECAPCEELLRQTMRLVAELNQLEPSVPVPLEAQAAWRRAIRSERTQARGSGRIVRFSRAVAGVVAALLILCGATWMSRLSAPGQTDAPSGGETVAVTALSADVQDAQGTAVYDAAGDAQRVYGRMSDGALKKEDSQPQQDSAATSDAAGDAGSEVRLARSAALQIETEDYSADCQMLESIVLSNGGYFELREQSQQGGSALHAVIRVPVDSYEDLLSQLEMVGRTVSRVERAQDMSAEYMDVDERLRVCQEKLQKLYLLQDECQDVNDLVVIAQTISEDLAESERLQSSRREIDSQAAYASVEINLAGRLSAAAQADSGSEQGVGERIRVGFAQSVEWMKQFCTDAFVLLVSSLPRLVVWIPALALIILLICWIGKKRR